MGTQSLRSDGGEQANQQNSGQNNQPQGGQTQNATNQSQGGQNFDFKSHLPQDLKDNPALAPFQDLASLAKSYLETKSMVGAETIKKLSNQATDEDKVAFLKKAFDVPAEFEKYEVTLDPKINVEEESYKEMKKYAYDMGLPQEMFGKLVTKLNEIQSRQVESITKKLDEKRKSDWQALEKRNGAAHEQYMALARTVLKDLGGTDLPHIEQEMSERGYDSSPWLAEVLIRAGKALYSEDKIRGMGKGTLQMSPSEANAKIAAIYANVEHPYFIRDHVNHEVAIEEMKNLQRLAAVGEKKDAA